MQRQNRFKATENLQERQHKQHSPLPPVEGPDIAEFEKDLQLEIQIGEEKFTKPSCNDVASSLPRANPVHQVPW